MGSADHIDRTIPISAAGSGDDLPTYTETDGGGLQSMIQQLSTLTDRLTLPITEYPCPIEYRYNAQESVRLQWDIIEAFFNAITTKKDEVVAMMIENNFVTIETTDMYGQTPLLAAVAAGNMRMVQELMDFGA